MKSIRSLYAILGLIGILITIQPATAGHYYFKKISLEDGFSVYHPLHIYGRERFRVDWHGGEGINILDPETHTIKILEHIPGNRYSLPVNSILSLYNDRNNNMWAGTIRSGRLSDQTF